MFPKKIIDPILAGSVPIYHGDAHISRYMPSNCFVDARAFKSASSLMHYIASMNKAEWACLHEAGTKFLLSEASLLFSSQKAAEKTGQFFYSLIVSS